MIDRPTQLHLGQFRCIDIAVELSGCPILAHKEETSLGQLSSCSKLKEHEKQVDLTTRNITKHFLSSRPIFFKSTTRIYYLLMHTLKV